MLQLRSLGRQDVISQHQIRTDTFRNQSRASFPVATMNEWNPFNFSSLLSAERTGRPRPRCTRDSATKEVALGSGDAAGFSIGRRSLRGPDGEYIGPGA